MTRAERAGATGTFTGRATQSEETALIFTRYLSDWHGRRGFRRNSRLDFRCPRTSMKAKLRVTTAGRNSGCRDTVGYPWIYPKHGRIRRGANIFLGLMMRTACNSVLGGT